MQVMERNTQVASVDLLERMLSMPSDASSGEDGAPVLRETLYPNSGKRTLPVAEEYGVVISNAMGAV